MSDYNLKPCLLALQPSRALALCFVLCVLAAIVCLYFTPFFVGKWVIAVFVLANGIYAVLQHAYLCLPWSLVQFEVNTRGECFVRNKRGDRLPVTVHQSTFVAHYLTVLNVSLPKKMRLVSMLIVPSRTQADEFRKLRVYLRLVKFK